MSRDRVLAIDQGTSGTKAIVVDPADGVVAEVEVGLQPDYLPGGGVELDPGALLESVLGAGREALAQSGGPVGAVALANQGETVLAWDPDTSRPLSRAIVWQDRRAAEVCDELSDHRDIFASRTGLVLDSYFSAPKMAWLRRHVTRDGVVTMTDSWLIHQLCGEFVTDASTASRSLLLDVDRVEWDDELLGLFGLDEEPLPRIVGCDETIGSTTAFGESMPVGGLVLDQPAALLAQGCLTPGSAKCTFGTGAFLLANSGSHAVRSRAHLTSSVAWRARGETVYCIDGQVYAAASAVRWLSELGFIAHARDLDTTAEDDAGGVLSVSALAGLAAPWWRSDATATFTGMTLATRPAHLVLAVLQGIAAQVAELADALAADLDDPLSSLRVDGGLTRSRVLMQAVADLTQLPVRLYPSPHATALGAAALGRLALDSQLVVSDAIRTKESGASYEPAWTTDQAGEFRDRWRRAAAANLPDAASPAR
ncbi:MAG: FGGY family carbohydrate kinase [Solirubrobacteraceae bacterium]